MDTIGERLRYARETAHERIGNKYPITQTEVAQCIGATQGFIYKLENNQNKLSNVDVNKLMRIAEFLRCSFLWLAKGVGDLNMDDMNLLDELNNKRGLPFYEPASLNSKTSEMELNLPSTLACKVSDKAFYTIVTDNAVNTRAAIGDLILVDPASDFRVGDFVLVKIADKPLPVVRRIVERNAEAGGYTLKSLNDEFADRPLEQLSDLLGVVLEFRSFTRDDASYKDRLNTTTSNVIQLVR